MSFGSGGETKLLTPFRLDEHSGVNAVTPTSIPQGHQGLGWFLRRTRDPIALTGFYESALGLPRLRSWDVPETAGVMLWCGDVGVLELNRISEDIAFVPERSPCTPVFLSRDLAASVTQCEAAGGKLISSTSDTRGEIMFFSDPEGFRFAIERVDRSDLPTDVQAQRKWDNGAIALPGDIRMDGAIQGISRILHESSDVQNEAAFLKTMGFKELSPNRISLGGTCHIELVQSDETLTQPKDRTMAFDTWIVRVYGLETYRDAFNSSKGQFLSRHEFQGGTLDYALSPSNVLMGWQERKPYDPDIPTTQMVEDLNARSQWMAQ